MSIDKIALIAYHAHCIDGFTSAWVTASCLERRGYKTELLAMNYDEVSIAMLHVTLKAATYMELYIVDYSLDTDVLEAIAKAYLPMQLTVIDHHKTAFEKYSPMTKVTPTSKLMTYRYGATIVLDNAECGASLCYRAFKNKTAPLSKLIEYVKDYDLGQFKYGDETKWVNKYLRSIERSLGEWNIVVYMMGYAGGLQKILTEGKYLQEDHDARVEALVKLRLPVNFNDISGLCVAASKEFSSDVGNRLAEIGGTFGATYIIDIKANKIHWSLRSKGDFDVSAIAKSKGGGGHKNAAGFSVDRETGVNKP